jgi:hypothetical protein
MLCTCSQCLFREYDRMRGRVWPSMAERRQQLDELHAASAAETETVRVINLPTDSVTHPWFSLHRKSSPTKTNKLPFFSCVASSTTSFLLPSQWRPHLLKTVRFFLLFS